MSNIPPDRDPLGLLRVEDVARIYDTSIEGIYVQRHRGFPPGSLGIKVGRRLFWRIEDLNDWMDSRSTDAVDAANKRQARYRVAQASRKKEKQRESARAGR